LPIFKAFKWISAPEEFEKDQIKGNLLAAITVDPQLIEARLKLTEIYIIEKNLKKAQEQIENLFRLSPPNLKIMTLLSGIKLLEGNTKAAEEILNIIIQQTPNYTPAFIRLGLLYHMTGKNEQAINLLKKAFEQRPDQLGIINKIIDIYTSENKYNDAIDLATSLMLTGNETTKAFFVNMKGEIYLKIKDSEAALDSFVMAKELNPTYIKPYMNIANILYSKKEFKKSLKEFQEIEQINPSNVEALIAIALISDIQGNFIQAEQYYRKVLEIIPDHPDATNNLAFILSEKIEFLEEAFRLAKIARVKSPKNPNVLDTLGWIYYQKGNYLGALSELNASLNINPNNALICFHYGMALYRTKEYEKAKKYIKKALKIDPQFKDAEKARKILN